MTEKKTHLPVKIILGYWPLNRAAVKMIHPAEHDQEKLKPNMIVELPVEEARMVVKKGIAERADDF